MDRNPTLSNNRRNQILPIAVAALAVMATACVTPLDIRRHTNVAFPNATADSILKSASTVVNTAQSGTDFACTEDFNTPGFFEDFLPHLFTRPNPVGTYTGPSNVNSAFALNAVLGTPGYVKVVNAISWCGGPPPNPNIIGCAPTPGVSMVVQRWTPANEGILWAHEYGHTVGLPHRNDPLAVMNPILNATRVEITSNECAAFVSRAVNNPFNTSGIVTGAVAGSKAEVKGDLYTTLDADLLTRPDRKLDVVSFVRQTYIHGTPMDLAAGFEGARNEQILVEMLEDSRESDHWGNIVAVLGMIGGADAVPHVITWLEMHGQSKPEWSSVREITAGNMALGYLANRTGSRDAIAYLVKTARTSGRANDPELDDALADAGAIGLALAGTENSLQLIEMIYDRYVSLDPKTTRAPLEQLVQINLEIQKYGLDGAYAR